MKNRVILLLAAIGLAGPAHSLDMNAVLKDLASDDYAVREVTRLELKQAFADASSPNAAGGELAVLESAVISSLGVELPRSEKLYLIRILEWFGTSRAVESLEVLLESPDRHVRDSTRRALAAIPGEEAGACLVKAMDSAPAGEIAGYIDALVLRDAPGTAERIIPFLKSDDPELTTRAAVALGKLGDEQALRALKKARRKSPGRIGEIIEIAMLDIGLPPSDLSSMARKSGSITIRHAAFLQLIEKDPVKARKVLKKVLKNGDFPGRTRLIHTAMRDGPEKLREMVIGILPEAEPGLQASIVLAIGEAGLSQYESQLLTLLEAAEGDLRDRLIQTIAKVGGDAAYPALYREYLETPRDRDLAYAIGRLRAPSADATALDMAQNGTDPEERATAMKILELRNSPGATELLNGILANSDDPDLQVAAAGTLEVIGDPESARILLDLVIRNSEPLKKFQLSLKRLSVNFNDGDYLWENGYRTAIEAAASDPARERVIIILDGCGGLLALEYLHGIVMDTDSRLRGTALRALSRWPHYAAGEIWLEIIDSGTATDAEIELAFKALVLLLGNNRVEGPELDKLDLAVQVIERAPSREIKLEVLDCYSGEKIHWRYKQNLKAKFTHLLSDPDISDRLQELIDKHS